VADLRVSNLANGFVLYFETPEQRINAYALASTLVALADAAKAAGRTLNSAVDIEIVVEALQSGSFKARITAIARESGQRDSKQLLSRALAAFAVAALAKITTRLRRQRLWMEPHCEWMGAW
jgi:hypothetical protein